MSDPKTYAVCQIEMAEESLLKSVEFMSLIGWAAAEAKKAYLERWSDHWKLFYWIHHTQDPQSMVHRYQIRVTNWDTRDDRS